MMTYEEFLTRKIKTHVKTGFDPVDLNENLFPFQKHIVTETLKMGKAALFADCGLGKTIMQLEWANQIVKKHNAKILVLAPLAVVNQTIDEGRRFGIDVSDIPLDGPGIYITNYEKLKDLDISDFKGVVLDESSILKNFTGKFRSLIIDLFQNTEYKLACTATPSPNDTMELCNHAEFLNVMSRTEMLAQYFIHDGGSTAKWRLKGHGVKRFFDFVSTWAVMLAKPSDIGFNDDGYVLPELRIEEITITTPHRNEGQLFNDKAVSATDFNQELRITLIDRIETAAELVNNSTENWICWVKQNEESKQLTKLITGSVEVKGSDDPEVKKAALLDFAKDKFKCLVTKSKIAQYGLNYQNCHNQIFVALDFSFESLYQSMRRSYRFGQKHPVNIYLITTDTMQNVLHAIKAKQEQFKQMQTLMTKQYV